MTRQALIFLIALAVCVGGVVAGAATLRERDEHLRGYVDATQDSNLPYRVPRLGVNADLTQYATDALPAQLELMRAAHVHWVRQFFRWDQIEPQPGQFDWTGWDAIVEAFADAPDLRLVAVLMYTPTWARDDSGGEISATGPPSDPADFAAFTRAFAERYGDVIDVYQVWDEPNLSAAWGGLEPRPVEYAALLQAAYTAIHSADPTAQVIAAALAPTVERGPANLSDLLYLEDLYTLGAREFMDAAAAKPYGFDAPPTERTVAAERLNFVRIVALREIMLRHDHGRAPLWASEWGWNHLPEDWPGEPSIWGAVGQDEQVTYTLDALARADREWPWLGGMIMQHWQPSIPEDHPFWGFALIDAQDVPTELYTALAARMPPSAASDGLHFPTTDFAQYSGVWTFGDLGADIGWVQDSQLTFDFAGSAVALLLRQDDYFAFLYPTINGQPANATPRDASGNAYINLKSATREPTLELVAVARDLGVGPHQLHLVADRGWDRWALAGYAVSSGDLAVPYNQQIAIAWLTALVGAVAALVTGRALPWRQIVGRPARFWSGLNDLTQLVIGAVTSAALLIGMLLTWGDAVPSLLRREPVQLGLAILSAGLIYLQLGLILTVAAALALLVIIYQRIELGLMLTIFYAPFFLFPVALYNFAFPMAELLLLITAAAWALRMLADWGQRRRDPDVPTITTLPSRFHVLDYGVVAWVLLGIVSLLWAD
ncbi:MAG: hypothetical protein GYB67_10880, partial [Chloroflexi bacterium]|nr:hypothetical protein [Chloroflexota bacterium]